MTVITRRGLIQVGAALAASGLALRKAAALGRPRGVELRVLFVDEKSSDADAFGRAAVALDLRVQVIGDELTEFYWIERPRKHDEPIAIGGLTRAPQLFILERLAWAAGMRLVFLGRHVTLNGEPAHALMGPQLAIDFFHTSVRLIDWRIALAHTLTEVPRMTPALKPVSAVRDAVIEGDAALFSWVAAPVPRQGRYALGGVA